MIRLFKINVNKKALVLILFWLIATAININKAFHIDDTFHLEAAKWIEKNPLNPMSGLINWHNFNEPIYNFNQPPGYFYLIALIGKVFGYGEFSLHLFQSIFTFLSILYFYKIANIFYPKLSLQLTTLLVIGPAFLVNQNLMIDIPILSLNLIFIYILIKPASSSEFFRYFFAALILSIALLFKYSNLPLLLLFPIVMILQKKYRYLYLTLVPVLFLALWSISNLYEFGFVHIANRPTNINTIRRIFDSSNAFFLTLGSIAPFSIALVPGFLYKFRNLHKAFIIGFLSFIIIYIFLFYAGLISNEVSLTLLRKLFLYNGIFLVLATLININFKSFLELTQKNINHIIIIMWFVSLTLFIILYAPFTATRHILLVLPSLILINAKILEKVSLRLRFLAIFITGLLGLSIAISDWDYADFYRKMAFRSKNLLPYNSVVWSAGHWGWQWYAKCAGMKQYVSDASVVNKNDYLIRPEKIDYPYISNNIQLEKIDSLTSEFKFYNFVSTGEFASFYCYGGNLPWYFSKQPFDKIYIYKVK